MASLLQVICILGLDLVYHIVANCEWGQCQHQEEDVHLAVFQMGRKFFFNNLQKVSVLKNVLFLPVLYYPTFKSYYYQEKQLFKVFLLIVSARLPVQK